MWATARYLRDYLLYLSVLSLVFIFMMPTASCETLPIRWMAGYCYIGPPGETYVPDYVSGRIECVPISNFVSYGDFGCEWVSIVLRYKPLYWVQVGYSVEWTLTEGVIKYFYAERYDETSGWPPDRHEFDAPEPQYGHTYRYIIYRGIRSDNYLMLIYDDSTILCSKVFYDLRPYLPVDLQAFVETTDPEIDISVSHFYDLRCGRPPAYWDRHVVIYDDPYYVDEGELGDVPDDPTIHYQFYAWNTL